ncbi:MAG: nucleotidyltransferase domain-containing protein [Desulfovibrio sp.]|jgi:hypothetical protein|nr:nucleotidyltransferase domain-containing protein [Desulfovibrio sp.]
MHLSGEQKNILLRQSSELCRERGARLLYLTVFGSALYGTETPGKSDMDVRGIFLPTQESLAVNEAAWTLRYSSGDSSGKNAAGDVDIDLWSVQHWLLKLLPAGDTGALDVLFSPSHAECTLHRDPLLDKVFGNPLKFVNAGEGRAYAEYSLGQAKKYGIRGSRLGALKSVHDWLGEHCPSPGPKARLRVILDPLLDACADGRFCAAHEAGGEAGLRLCGKVHLGGIHLREFAQRVEADMRRYGARVEKAGRNQGIDFKALSHALRALDQMEELLQTGAIVFPLKSRERLTAVKQGAYTWNELEPRILSRLAEIDAMRKDSPWGGVFDAGFARDCVLEMYRRRTGGQT